MKIFIISWFAAMLVAQPVYSQVNRTTVRIIQYQVKPAYQETFKQAISSYVAKAMKATGNIMAEAYYEERDPSTLWIIERWSNRRLLRQNNSGEEARAIANLSKRALEAPADTFFMKDLEPLPREAYHKQPALKDRPLTIMLFVDARPGTEDEFKRIYHRAMPAFRSEPGVITYQLSELMNDKTKFVTYEKFYSQASFDYHLKFPPIEPVVHYLRTSIKEQPFEKGLHRLIQLPPLYGRSRTSIIDVIFSFINN